jgi:P pilus assembly chaperone PapD
MFGLPPLKLHAAVAAIVMVVASAVPASAINVAPVIVDLLASGRRSSAIVTMQNTFSTTVPVELTASVVELVDNEFRAVDGEVEDLLVFPSQAVVEPGQSQAFRIQWVGDQEPDQSRHFYVSVNQLPIDLPENENALQVLYSFRVLVNVAAASASEIQTTEGRSVPVIEVENTGQAYGYVGKGRMTVVQTNDAGQEVFRESYEPDVIQRVMGLGLVPSGKTRRLPMNIELPQSTGTLTVTLAPVEGR